MLKIDDNLTFIGEVKVNINGRQAATFKAELRLLPTDQVEAMQAKVNANTMTGRQFAEAVLAGWPAGEVALEDDTPLPADDINRARLLNQPGVAAGVIQAFWKGYEPATEGNSEPLPAG